MTTKTEVKYTPTPWHAEKSGYTGHTAYIYSENGKALASTIHPDFGLDEQAANVDFIVRACNSHEELLEACKELEDILSPEQFMNNSSYTKAVTKLRATIAKAYGGK